MAQSGSIGGSASASNSNSVLSNNMGRRRAVQDAPKLLPPLPQAIFYDIILEFAVGVIDPATIGRMSAACKRLRDLVGGEHSPAFRRLAATGCRVPANAPGPKYLTPKRIVQLCSLDPGCEVCGAARIRKIHWEFRMKCCKECLHEATVAEFYVLQHPGVSASMLLKLPSTISRIFMNRPGQQHVYNVRHLLKSDVLVALRACGVAGTVVAPTYDSWVAALREAAALASQAAAREEAARVQARKDAAAARAALSAPRKAQIDDWLREAGLDPASDDVRLGSAEYRHATSLVALPRKSAFLGRTLGRITAEAAAASSNRLAAERAKQARLLTSERENQARLAKCEQAVKDRPEQERRQERRSVFFAWARSRHERGPFSCPACSRKGLHAQGFWDHVRDRHPGLQPQGIEGQQDYALVPVQ